MVCGLFGKSIVYFTKVQTYPRAKRNKCHATESLNIAWLTNEHFLELQMGTVSSKQSIIIGLPTNYKPSE